MKTRKQTEQRRKQNINQKEGRHSFHSFVMITACAVLAVVIAVGSKVLGGNEQDQVFAASGSKKAAQAVLTEKQDKSGLPSGIAGIANGVGETPLPGSTIKRIGTSCEEVIVGQRVQKVSGNVADMNVSESMATTVDDLDSKAISLAENPKMMSDNDYETLLRIVEAEAGSEDLKGRIMVANVIMNRVKHDEFPGSVTEVVWEYRDGVPQFSPTYDGRINEVTVSDETKEAVKQVLEGVDYSEGALFFIQKSAAEAHNVSWFEKDLKKLFRHGVHEFYTYPDEKELKEREKKEKEAKEKEEKEKKEKEEKVPELVQMVKAGTSE